MPNTEPLESVPSQQVVPYHKGVPLEKIIDLKLKGLTNQQIGSLLGLSDNTVRARLRTSSEDIDNTELFRKHRDKVFAFQSKKILQSITDADILKAGLRDKVIAASILFDKERLESGKSTQNIAYIDMIKAKSSAGTEMQAIEAELIEAGIELDDTP